MNQEQNNLNPNNFNTQGNNGIPNNQPLNNKNFNQGMGFNQQPINPQPQPTPSYQQPIMQEPTPQPMNNTFESGNTGNQSFSSKPPKKMNLGLIIGIVAVVAVVGVGIVFGSKLLSNDGNNNNPNNDSNNNGSSQNQNVSNNSIKDIKVNSYSNVVALTNNGSLYVIGKENYDELGLGENSDYSEKAIQVATDVKSFFYNGGAVYYIDNNNDLYRAGLKIPSGQSDNFEKINSNVSSVSSGMGLCVMTIDSNNGLYANNGKFSNNSCGLKEIYSEFTKIADNIKFSFNHFLYGGYVNANGELFVSSSSTNGYEKILDNVKKVSHDGNLILTNDNVLYKYGDTLTKISDSVSDINEKENHFIKDNKIYFYAYKYNLADSSLITYTEFEEYAYLNADDVKKIIYVDNGRGRYIYQNSSNEFILLDSNNKNNIGNSVNSLEKILKFIEA